MKTCGTKNKWKWKRVEMKTCGNETMWNENAWKWKHVEMNTSRRRSVFLSRYLFLVSLSSRVRCFFVYIVLSFPLFLNLRMFSFCIWFSPCYFVDVYAIGMHLGCNWDSIEIQLEFNWNSIQILFVVFSFPLFSNLHCFYCFHWFLVAVDARAISDDQPRQDTTTITTDNNDDDDESDDNNNKTSVAAHARKCDDNNMWIDMACNFVVAPSSHSRNWRRVPRDWPRVIYWHITAETYVESFCCFRKTIYVTNLLRFFV